MSYYHYGRVLKNQLERIGIIYEHIASGCSHEELDATRLSHAKPFDLLDVGICAAQVKPIVGGATIFSDTIFVRQRLTCRR